MKSSGGISTPSFLFYGIKMFSVFSERVPLKKMQIYAIFLHPWDHTLCLKSTLHFGYTHVIPPDLDGTDYS